MDAADRVSAEFTGRARAFHTALITDSQASLARMHQIRTDAERLSARRGPKPFRPEVLVELERNCQLAPMGGCLRRNIQRGKKTLNVANIWMIPTFQRAGEWAAGIEEVSIDLLADVTEIDRYGQVNRDTHSLAVVSLHGLARWYCRAFSTNEMALLGDLEVLTSFAEGGIGKPGQEFVLSTENGGSWRGHAGTTTHSWGGGDAVLQCRTFY
jgi:hypothetical protein